MLETREEIRQYLDAEIMEYRAKLEEQRSDHRRHLLLGYKVALETVRASIFDEHLPFDQVR